jgi:rfaE bifunctional protein nucleotidyltransferase chain/domain
VSSAGKVVTRDELLRRAARWRADGKTVAMANGLFDIVHVGHLRYLEEAATLADVLVVAINDDASARALKGPDRPIVPQDERAELVAGFRCVEVVTLFNEATVEPLLRALVPAVHCKGTDYTQDTVPERETARQLGIRVAITGDPKTHATRDMIRRIRD